MHGYCINLLYTLTLLCWLNLAWKPSLPGVDSVIRHLLSGTHSDNSTQQPLTDSFKSRHCFTWLIIIYGNNMTEHVLLPPLKLWSHGTKEMCIRSSSSQCIRTMVSWPKMIAAHLLSIKPMLPAETLPALPTRFSCDSWQSVPYKLCLLLCHY